MFVIFMFKIFNKVLGIYIKIKKFLFLWNLFIKVKGISIKISVMNVFLKKEFRYKRYKVLELGW